MMALNHMVKRFCKATVIILSFNMASSFAANNDIEGQQMTVSIHQGDVQGKVNADVTSFYGIPYAHDPFTKARRFKAPQAYEKWEGVLDATKKTAPVPQPGREQTVELVGATGDLTLNIWAPTAALQSNKQLPVMVWIPGGAFIRADAGEETYNGTSFAKNDAIVVTVNYRVGVDGFMHLDGAPDNRGILDQIAALQWVQKNIANFGGNPENVTLFGQSAGAESVAILLGTDKAKGLFQQAIMQSPPMQFMTMEQADRVSQTFAKELGVSATISDISQIPLETLVTEVIDIGNTIKNRDQWGMMSWGGTAFLPVADGDVIKESPMRDLANNTDPAIPVIVGSTDQEARLYYVPGGAIDQIPATQRSQLLSDLSLSGASRDVYAPIKNKKSIGDSFADIQSDYTFRMPAVHIAEHLVNNGNKVWHYNFSWFSPAFDGKLGAAHFVDVPFTFNALDSEQAKSFIGDQPSQKLADTMHQNWIEFARSGQAPWDNYRLADRATMVFDTDSKIVNDPERDVRVLWKNYSF